LIVAFCLGDSFVVFFVFMGWFFWLVEGRRFGGQTLKKVDNRGV